MHDEVGIQCQGRFDAEFGGRWLKGCNYILAMFITFQIGILHWQKGFLLSDMGHDDIFNDMYIHLFIYIYIMLVYILVVYSAVYDVNKMKH